MQNLCHIGYIFLCFQQRTTQVHFHVGKFRVLTIIMEIFHDILYPKEFFAGNNMKRLQLDRNLSNKRIFPAVNITASSTRRDDLLLDKTTLDRMWILRKYLADMNPIEAMDFVKDRLEKTRDNDEFLMSMNS